MYLPRRIYIKIYLEINHSVRLNCTSTSYLNEKPTDVKEKFEKPISLQRDRNLNKILTLAFVTLYHIPTTQRDRDTAVQKHSNGIALRIEYLHGNSVCVPWTEQEYITPRKLLWRLCVWESAKPRHKWNKSLTVLVGCPFWFCSEKVLKRGLLTHR